MERFQDFNIIEKIGSGATSDVYLGQNSQGQKRALKVFNQCLPEEHGDITFRRELSNLERLRNDKIISVYGLDKNEKGNWVLIQEYIKGRSLKEYSSLSLGPVDRVILALIVGVEILYALEESHNKAIIHRDIKPENILISDDHRIVLSDFGLSKDLNLDQKTLHGGLFGSPQYMSIEQFGSGTASEKTDLYSIAVLLYETITGTSAYAGNNIEDILRAKREGDFKSIGKANIYSPFSLNKIISSIMKGTSSLTRAYQLRYELLKVLDDFKIDYKKSLENICENKTIVEGESEVHFVEGILRELENQFDREKNKTKKNQILGQIIKIDPSNMRADSKRNKKIYFYAFALILVAALIIFNNRQLKKEEPIIAKEKTEKPIIVKEKVENPVVAKKEVKKVISEPKKTKKVKKKKIAKPIVQYGHLVVNVPSDISVYINDKRVLELNKKLKYKAGQYNIRLEKEGYPSMNSKIVIKNNESTVINLGGK